MTKAEILVTTVGEMSDMMACHAIANGYAKEKTQMTFDEMLGLR